MVSMNEVIGINKNHKDSAALKVCKQSISNYNMVMYFPKSFYLNDAIDDAIRKLTSSGIMSHIIGKYFDMRYWIAKRVEKEPHQLTIEHLQGAFGLLIILSLTSFVLFLVEFPVFAFFNSRQI